MDNAQENLESIKKKNSRLKTALTITLILLFLSLTFITYIFIYNAQLDPDPKDESPDVENTVEENLDISTPDNQEIDNNYNITFWDYSTEKNIGINIEGFEEIVEAGDSIWPSHKIFMNDTELSGDSSYQILSYYRNLEILLQVSADDINFEITDLDDLERVEGFENAYYLRQTPSTNENRAMGTVLQLEPTITVQGYQAFKVIEYYNLIDLANGESSYVPDNYSVPTSINCIIGLDQAAAGSEGYIEYSGVHPAGSEVNSCDILDSLNEFSIETY
jgi:hypothetical protein